MSLELAWPIVLLTLPLPLITAWLLPKAAVQDGPALRVPFYNAIGPATDRVATRSSRPRLALAILAWVLLVIAGTRPQFIGEPITLPVSGRSVLLAVDISGSMETPDMVLNNRQVDRLSAVKVVAGEFIERRVGDRLGLILFGSRAYLQTPLTFDRLTVSNLLFEAAIGLAGKETAIGDAIGLAIKRLRDQSEQDRVLILLTDGANTAGSVDPLKAADLAAQEKVRVYTIGVGADDLLIPSFFGTRRVNPSAELDEETLQTIADKTGGRYFRARDIEGLNEIYRLLDKLEPIAQDEDTFRPIKELYGWPLTVALLLSVLLALPISKRLMLGKARHAY